LPKFIERPGTGVMEYWSAGKKDVNPLAIIPILQNSNTPKFIKNESAHDGLLSFGLSTR
jgi:hypothetical protein